MIKITEKTDKNEKEGELYYYGPYSWEMEKRIKRERNRAYTVETSRGSREKWSRGEKRDRREEGVEGQLAPVERERK